MDGRLRLAPTDMQKTPQCNLYPFGLWVKGGRYTCFGGDGSAYDDKSRLARKVKRTISFSEIDSGNLMRRMSHLHELKREGTPHSRHSRAGDNNRNHQGKFIGRIA